MFGHNFTISQSNFLNHLSNDSEIKARNEFIPPIFRVQLKFDSEAADLYRVHKTKHAKSVFFFFVVVVFFFFVFFLCVCVCVCVCVCFQNWTFCCCDQIILAPYLFTVSEQSLSL